MLKMNVVRAALVAVVACLMLVAGGCGGKGLKMADIVVTPDNSLRDSGGRLPQVEVSLVGVGASDTSQWSGYKVDDFFSGSDRMRNDARGYTKTLTFSNDRPGAQTIKSSDPIFKEWKKRGVTGLVIFANSRNLMAASAGADARRKEIPLTTDRWKTDRIDIVIKSSGIDVPTPMEPVK